MKTLRIFLQFLFVVANVVAVVLLIVSAYSDRVSPETSMTLSYLGLALPVYIIMDYGSILIQQPIETLMKELRRYTCTVPEGYQPQLPATCYHPAVIRQTLETYSFLPLVDVEKLLKESQVPFTGLQHENVSLEDAFIGLTGKY